MINNNFLDIYLAYIPVWWYSSFFLFAMVSHYGIPIHLTHLIICQLYYVTLRYVMVMFISFLFAMVSHHGKIYPFDAFNYISTICICQNTILLPVNMLKITNSMYVHWNKAFRQPWIYMKGIKTFIKKLDCRQHFC